MPWKRAVQTLQRFRTKAKGGNIAPHFLPIFSGVRCPDMSRYGDTRRFNDVPQVRLGGSENARVTGSSPV